MENTFFWRKNEMSIGKGISIANGAKTKFKLSFYSRMPTGRILRDDPMPQGHRILLVRQRHWAPCRRDFSEVEKANLQFEQYVEFFIQFWMNFNLNLNLSQWEGGGKSWGPSKVHPEDHPGQFKRHQPLI